MRLKPLSKLILIALGLLLSAESPIPQPKPSSVPKSPSPQVSKQAANTQPAQNAATPTPTILIKREPAQVQKDQRTSETYASREAFYTGWLVIVGALGIIFQYWAAHSSAKASEKGANAAISASAAHLHLLRVRLGDQQDQDIMDDGVGVIDPVLHYGFTNYGKTPAYLDEMCWEYLIAPRLPDAPVYNNRGPVNGLLVVAGEQDIDHEFKWNSLFNKYLTEDDIGPVRRKETKLFVFGFFRFVDVFERRCSVGFAYHVDARGVAHVVDPEIAPAYWYRRGDEPPRWWRRFLPRS